MPAALTAEDYFNERDTVVDAVLMLARQPVVPTPPTGVTRGASRCEMNVQFRKLLPKRTGKAQL
jgi:hypothetical protein